MRNGVVLITNNSSLCGAVFGGRLVEGSSLDVLTAARDAVHLGASLLTHPLCGNLRPHQQPFRSVLIEENPGALVDLESLSLIDSAVTIYRDCARLPLPEDLEAAVRRDYAFVDFELMRDSLERYGILPRIVSPVFGKV
ncbi:MAG: GrdX family protein [Synergistaceae bacterium]|jgi:hypothetical protein|nr:GrdX family protein [Synergistaceae bacterium]